MQYRSLLELNQLIRNTLDSQLEPAYWVVGEIADMRMNARGHCYFELIEKEDEKVVARMRANIWAYTYRGLSAWFESQSGQSLKNGLKVLCQVNVNFHELYGLSLNVREIDPRFTLGERARKRKEIIERLTHEGVFDLNKMHNLPVLPRRIAVISSATAAGYGDFMNQLTGNPWGYTFQTRLFNATMQGDDAPPSIMQALDTIYAEGDTYDLVLIMRGGGAQVDLDCFDTYDLSNHIAQFPLPVITGIGHERDETIADLVAHTSVKTPTAAAEFIISGIRSFEERLIEAFQRLVNETSGTLQNANQRLQNIQFNLKSEVSKKLHRMENQLQDKKGRLVASSRLRLADARSKVELAESVIEKVDPTNVLKRGYSITLKDGKAVKGDSLSEGDELTTLTSTHKLISTIKEIQSNE